jgi:hypothetical protein
MYEKVDAAKKNNIIYGFKDGIRIKGSDNKGKYRYDSVELHEVSFS